MGKTQIRWIVGLSNSCSIQEEKGNFKNIHGELSPWQKLLKYTEEQEANITSLSLFVDGKRWNLPSAGKNPKFREFALSEKPIKYLCFKKIGADILNNNEIENEELFVVAQAEYESGRKLQIWIRDKSPFPSWSLFL